MQPPSSRPGPAPGSRVPPEFGADGARTPSDIVVTVSDPGWRRIVRGAETVARRAAWAAGGRGAVVLASDREVRRLNHRHRGRNKPTNVLSFELPPPFGGGDVVLALGVVCREARDNGRRPADHLAHLVVHGMLHLAGHDHAAVGDARRMEATEARILRRIGISNPWKHGRSRLDGAA